MIGSARPDAASDPGRAADATLFSPESAPPRLRLPDGTDFGAVARRRIEAIAQVPERFAAYPEAAATLREIAAMQIPRAVLADGWSGVGQRMAALAGFDGPVLLSEDLECEAGAPMAFAALARTLHLPAECIWYVGSDPVRDIRPAQAAGLRTVYLARDGRPFPAGSMQPDARIGSLHELLPVLSGPYTRGSLELRYLLRAVMHWRPGHSVPVDPAEPQTSDDTTGD